MKRVENPIPVIIGIECKPEQTAGETAIDAETLEDALVLSGTIEIQVNDWLTRLFVKNVKGPAGIADEEPAMFRFLNQKIDSGGLRARVPGGQIACQWHLDIFSQPRRECFRRSLGDRGSSNDEREHHQPDYLRSP